MDESNRDKAEVAASTAADVTSIVRQAIEEFTQRDQAKNEPAYKAELQEERRRREQLERRLNELVEENRRSKQIAEDAQTGSAIRAELQRLGVAKVDLAFRAIREDIVRAGRARRERRDGGEGLSHQLRQRESGIPAGADLGRVGGDVGPEGAATGAHASRGSRSN
jgi:hypothetical protein